MQQRQNTPPQASTRASATTSTAPQKGFITEFANGFRFALSGFGWIMRPRIRRFIYIPLAINLILFATAIGLLASFAEAWVSDQIGQKTDWWGIFQWAYDIIVPILRVVIYAALFFIGYFSFSVVANIIAAPFNALLSKAVEQRLQGQTISYSELPLAKEIWITVKAEIVKLLRFLGVALLLLLTLMIPGVNLLFPLLWFVFMAYTLSLQYADYPMANHGHFYATQRKVLKKNRSQRLGFGTAANVMLLIPVVNFVAMPVCVCGATVWWYESLCRDVDG